MEESRAGTESGGTSRHPAPAATGGRLVSGLLALVLCTGAGAATAQSPLIEAVKQGDGGRGAQLARAGGSRRRARDRRHHGAPLGGPPRRRRHRRRADRRRGGRDGGQPLWGGADRAGEPQRQRADAGPAAGRRGGREPGPAGRGDRADDRGPHGAGRGGPAPDRSRSRYRRGRAVARPDRADVGRGRGSHGGGAGVGLPGGGRSRPIGTCGRIGRRAGGRRCRRGRWCGAAAGILGVSLRRAGRSHRRCNGPGRFRCGHRRQGAGRFERAGRRRRQPALRARGAAARPRRRSQRGPAPAGPRCIPRCSRTGRIFASCRTRRRPAT